MAQIIRVGNFYIALLGNYHIATTFLVLILTFLKMYDIMKHNTGSTNRPYYRDRCKLYFKGGMQMPKFNIVVEHNLSQEQALERIQKLLGEVKNQFADQISDLQESWIGNTGKFSFSTMGFSVSGIITVHFSYVELSGKLPFTGAVFKKKIEKVILERAKTLFA